MPTTPKVKFRHMIAVCTGPNGEISCVINDEGGPAKPSVKKTPEATDYPAAVK